MIGNSGMRKQFFANPTRDWFIWRENKKDRRLRASKSSILFIFFPNEPISSRISKELLSQSFKSSTYRAFSGDINFS